jgi:fatty acid desaturase
MTYPAAAPDELPPDKASPDRRTPESSGISDLSDEELDPVFLNGRREALAVFVTWLAAFLWAVPYCATHAYTPVDPQNLKTLWGIPEWTFWGIFLPWLVADVVTIWLCFGYMRDDELDPETPLSSDESGVAA